MLRNPRIVKWSLLAFALMLVGCGQADYDRLVAARLADLRSGRGAVARWEAFSSPQFGYMAEVPGKPQSAQSFEGSFQMEKVDTNVGLTAYQILVVRGSNESLDDLASNVRRQFEAIGYRFDERNDGALDSVKYARLSFSKNDGEDAAQVQVMEMGVDRRGTFTVVGPTINDTDVERFFNSIALYQ